MTDTQLALLKELYAEFIIDGMDYKTMEQFVFDTIIESVAGMDADDFLAELANHADPETIEDMIESTK